MRITSMKQFRDVVMSNISKSMEEEVSKKVVNMQRKEIARVVYRSYDPSRYERRYFSGGIMARKNMSSQVGITHNTARLNVYNKTKANTSKAGYTPINGGNYLAPLIVLGHFEHKRRYGGEGYSWHPKDVRKGDEANYAKPRNFLKATREEMNKSKAHVKALEDGLKKRKIIK